MFVHVYIMRMYVNDKYQCVNSYYIIASYILAIEPFDLYVAGSSGWDIYMCKAILNGKSLGFYE